MRMRPAHRSAAAHSTAAPSWVAQAASGRLRPPVSMAVTLASAKRCRCSPPRPAARRAWRAPRAAAMLSGATRSAVSAPCTAPSASRSMSAGGQRPAPGSSAGAAMAMAKASGTGWTAFSRRPSAEGSTRSAGGAAVSAAAVATPLRWGSESSSRTGAASAGAWGEAPCPAAAAADARHGRRQDGRYGGLTMPSRVLAV